ncbi:family 20 glycosylhydrolase [Jejubacter calystegiae]|nr:family 20 glycosylhydrolase [Jejubacter calystegiae]
MPDVKFPENSIIPSIKEYSTVADASLSLNKLTTIYISNENQIPDLESKLAVFIEEFKLLTGKALTLTYDKPVEQAGCIIVEINSENASGYFDEHYIDVMPDELRIASPTVSGIFFATRTVLQFAQRTGTIPVGNIHDYSLVKERGLLLDVARKYFPVAWVKKLIEHMAALKLNVLQLHLSDNEGFRLETSVDKDKYGVDFETPSVLTKNDILEIIQYAKERCISVIPEFDSPGHMANIIDKLQEHDADKYNDISSGILTKNNLNIKSALAKQIVSDIINEWADAFEGCPDFHLGGDEFYVSLLPLIFGITHDDAVTYLNELSDQVIRKGMKPRVWNDEIFRDGWSVEPNKNGVICYWSATIGFAINGQVIHLDHYAPVMDFISRGYQVVNANQNYLYYSHGNYQPKPQEIYTEWTPLVFAGKNEGIDAQQVIDDLSQVVGALYCVWCDGGDSLEEDIIYQDIKLAIRSMSEKSWASDTANDYSLFTALSDDWEPIHL